jgi:hypothetical protein
MMGYFLAGVEPTEPSRPYISTFDTEEEKQAKEEAYQQELEEYEKEKDELEEKRKMYLVAGGVGTAVFSGLGIWGVIVSPKAVMIQKRF